MNLSPNAARYLENLKDWHKSLVAELEATTNKLERGYLKQRLIAELKRMEYPKTPTNEIITFICKL